MNERAEAEPAAIVRSGYGGLWLDGLADQSEGSGCLHSSRGVNPPREPWPRSKPVAEGRAKPTLALSLALCTPMGLLIRQHWGGWGGLGRSHQLQSWLFTDSWLTVATTPTLVSATLSYATVWMAHLWFSADNCSWKTHICMYVGQYQSILYVNKATLLCSGCKIPR